MEQRKSSRINLTEGPIIPGLLRFAVPILLGSIVTQLYNVADSVIVGRFVGTVALASVGGSAAQIINLLIGFFVAITSGASVVIAQVYGAGRTRDVQLATGNAIAVFSLLGLLLMVFGLIASPAMLRLLQTLDEDPGELFFMGDTFDFWMGYRHTVFAPYVPFLERLRQLREREIPITLLEGNHDFLLGPYFDELGCTVLPADTLLVRQTKRRQERAQ